MSVKTYALTHEWTWHQPLCDLHADARRATWSVAQLVGPFPAWLECGDCARDREAARAVPDEAAALRATRAATRDPNRIVRIHVGGKLIERTAGSYAFMPSAGDGKSARP